MSVVIQPDVQLIKDTRNLQMYQREDWQDIDTASELCTAHVTSSSIVFLTSFVFPCSFHHILPTILLALLFFVFHSYRFVMVLLTSTFFLSFLSSVSSLSSVFCSFSLYLLTVFLLLTFSFQFNFCFSLLQLSLHVSISALCSLLYLLPLFYFTSFLLVLVSVFSPIPHSIFSYFPSFLTVPHLNIGIVHIRLFTLSLSLFLFFGFFLS